MLGCMGWEAVPARETGKGSSPTISFALKRVLSKVSHLVVIVNWPQGTQTRAPL